jgi:hypothetical protein
MKHKPRPLVTPTPSNGALPFQRVSRTLTTFLSILPPTVCIKRLYSMYDVIDHNEAVDYTVSNPTARIKPTARAFDVAPRTLSRRLNGGLARQEGHSGQQILSSPQEKMLVSWILEQERLRHASTY